MHTHTYGRWENLEDFNMKLLYKLMHLANNIFMMSFQWQISNAD